MEWKLGYDYRADGNFLIQKTCSHCGEKYDVVAIANALANPRELCPACKQVDEWERKP